MWWLIAREWLGDAALGALAMMWVHQHQAPAPPPAPPVQSEAPAPLIVRPVPGRPRAHGQRISFAADADDQCYLDGEVRLGSSTTQFHFLLDSGAGGPPLSFGPQHVRSLGLDPAALVYDRRVATANGLGRAALIYIDEIRIAGTVFRNLSAHVEEGGMDTALLGAGILRRLNFQYANGACVITVTEERTAPRRATPAISSEPAGSPIITADPLASMGLKLAASGFAKGVVIVKVDQDSSAGRSGLEGGEMILEVQTEAVSSPQDVADKIADLQKAGRKSVLLRLQNGDAQWFAALKISG